jgi:hypothetical protein
MPLAGSGGSARVLAAEQFVDADGAADVAAVFALVVGLFRALTGGPEVGHPALDIAAVVGAGPGRALGRSIRG